MIILYVIIGLIALVFLMDILQRQHAILHNFPILGHFRYLLEAVGPELRQYIVTGNNEERPFSRDQRRWVYASSKKENNYFGFGTDEDLEHSANYLIIKHSMFPISPTIPGDPKFDPQFRIPCAKVLGTWRNRKKSFRPQSVINISGMSFGSLSANAVSALNQGANLSGCLHSTGEGAISPYHDEGGELVWQIGSGYFGCRDKRGRFDLGQFTETALKHNVRAVEIKISQGAKPGAGGVLPAKKITKEIARIRGIPMGRDCISPAAHTEFSDADSLLDFAEKLADASGLPVGIKTAVGDLAFFEELADKMSGGERGLDFITIDGGEGGTGAGPLVFTDHVAFPFKVAFAEVYKVFAQRNLADKIVFIGSGKLGWPESAILAFALGADMVSLGRSAMLAIGCIQAQRCHTNHCPTGVATQNPWLARGLDPTLKAARLANYILTLRKEILNVCYACGVRHPAFVSADHLEILDDRYGKRTLEEVFGYEKNWSKPADSDLSEIERIMQSIITSLKL